MNLGLDPAHRFERNLVLQRLNILELYLQRIKVQQRRALAVLHRDIAQGQLAADADHRLVFLLEADLQIRVQHARQRLHGNAGRHIAQIRGQIDVLPFELHRRLAGVGERRALARCVELAAVEIESQMRQHLDLALGGQIADERNAQLQVLELVLALHKLVIELDTAVAHCNVVERKAQGLGRLFVLRLGEPGNHIVDIELAQ